MTDAAAPDGMTPVDAQVAVDMGLVDAEMPTPQNTDGGVAQAHRTPYWVCDTQFGADGANQDPARFHVARFAPGQGFVVLERGVEPCTFFPVVVEADDSRHRLTEAAAGYLFATTLTDEGVRGVCLSRIDHVAAEGRGGPDPDGVMTSRRTVGVSVECAAFFDGRWSPLRVAIPSTMDWAAWVAKLERIGADTLRLTYERDFSMNFMNLTHAGRPETDGTYALDIAFRGGAMEMGENTKLSDQMFGDIPVDRCGVDGLPPDDPACAARCGDGSCDPGEQCGANDGDDDPLAQDGICRADCGFCTKTMDDAHDPGFRELRGEWGNNAGHEGFSRHTLDGAAEFEFRRMPSGWKQLSVHLPAHPDNTPKARYTVWAGETEVAGFELDQRVERDEWRSIGKVFTRGAFRVEVASAGEGRMQADAIRAELSEAPGPIIDNGDLRYRESAGGWATAPGGHEGDHRESRDGEGRFESPVQPGVYEISVHYPAVDNAGGRVSHELIVDGVVRGRLSLDQRNEAGTWINLGRHTIVGTTLAVGIRSEDGQLVLADAVRVEAVGGLHEPQAYTVAPGDALYAERGDWRPAPQGDGRLSGEAEASAAWQFSGLTPGAYVLLARIESDEENAQAASYVLTEGGREVARFDGIDTRRGGPGWTRVGTLFVSSAVATITLSQPAGEGQLYADAVRLVSMLCEECDRGE